MTTTKALVRKLLQQPHAAGEWSLQGLGMLRLYLTGDKSIRMHVWDSRFATPGASEMHTHPWNMTSEIIAGVVHQHRYVASLDTVGNYMEQSLLCGPGGGLCEAPRSVALRECPEEVYTEGDVYAQTHYEIHRSFPEDGTVTIVTREFTGKDDHAYVYWPVGETWGSAEPRRATITEINEITGFALNRWFNS